MLFRSSMSNHKNQQKLFLATITRYIFEISLITFLAFFFLEFYKTGVITNYIHFNVILIVVMFFGIVTILLSEEKVKNKAFMRLIYGLVLAVFSGLFIYTILPETYELYQYVPWVTGLGVFFSIWIMKT